MSIRIRTEFYSIVQFPFFGPMDMRILFELGNLKGTAKILRFNIMIPLIYESGYSSLYSLLVAPIYKHIRTYTWWTKQPPEPFPEYAVHFNGLLGIYPTRSFKFPSVWILFFSFLIIRFRSQISSCFYCEKTWLETYFFSEKWVLDKRVLSWQQVSLNRLWRRNRLLGITVIVNNNYIDYSLLESNFQMRRFGWPFCVSR